MRGHADRQPGRYDQSRADSLQRANVTNLAVASERGFLLYCQVCPAFRALRMMGTNDCVSHESRSCDRLIANYRFGSRV